MFAARPTTSPDSPTRLEEPRCRATLSRTDFPAPVCVARAVVLHRTPHWCPTPSADRIASHPFSRSLAPRVRCKTLLLPDVLRRWSSDHFLTLCDGSPELMGASGGGPDPPMAPGLIPGIGASCLPHHHHCRTSLPSAPSSSPPPRSVPPLSFLLHPPPHGSTSPEGPWPAAAASMCRHRQPDGRTATPRLAILRLLRAIMAR